MHTKRRRSVFRDGGLTDVDPEFQQFAMNPRRAPARIRLRHRANQRTDVGRYRRSPYTASAFPGPPQAEAASVAGDDGFRLDDDERRSPSAQHTREYDPEPTVRLREPQPPRPGALQHLPLVPQGQHLELERGARPRPFAEGQERATSTDIIARAYPSPAATSKAATRTDFLVKHSIMKTPTNIIAGTAPNQ
jgi:hypothetical protein